MFCWYKAKVQYGIPRRSSVSPEGVDATLLGKSAAGSAMMRLLP